RGDLEHVVRLFRALVFPATRLCDGLAGIVDAVGGQGPAVVEAGAGEVDLVAAARAVLAFPELAGARIDGQALGVAVAVAPDLRARAVAADAGIVRRDAAVQAQADQLALELVQRLRHGLE